jgi:IS5 family transposase
MRPKRLPKARHDDLFRARLDQIINMKHELVVLADKIDWAWLDEQVWDRWVQDPFFQYFAGEEFFQHTLPHERSGMSHWRKRIGGELDILLQESLRPAHDTSALKKRDLARVTGDTTVQPKNVAFPTDAKLLETAIRQFGKLAKEHDVPLRQSYRWVSLTCNPILGWPGNLMRQDAQS